jgi:hypothetical protein
MASSLPAPVRRVILALCEDADTAVSLSVAIQIKYEQYSDLLKRRIRPIDYISANAFRRDNAVCSFLRKCVDVPCDVDANTEAWTKWLAAERQCYRTNVLFRRFNEGGPFEDPNELRIHEILVRVSKAFNNILGPLPRGLSRSKLGPGSTFSDRGKLATIPDKFTSRPTISSEARALLPFWEGTAWARNLVAELPSCSDFTLVTGSCLETLGRRWLCKRSTFDRVHEGSLSSRADL